MKILKKIRYYYFTYFSKFFDGKIKLLNRHSSYESYLNKQIEKTLDPKRISIWQNDEWQIKVEGFKKIFDRNWKYIKNKKKAICLGSRTGQEVFVLREMGMDAIGIDLVEFPPYTIKGDIHDLKFDDNKFDLVFTNIIDHALYLDKFFSEVERVSKKEAIIILNLQVKIPIDDYSENIINDPIKIIEMFKFCKLLNKGNIKNSFDSMNYEIILQKN